ncbi:hypothetical protein WDU94_006514, partial [Cyamophila willieti]
QEQQVVIDGKTINYLKTGSGEHNVLCLPGALGSIWSDFGPQIEGLSKTDFTLVVWDPPGYGFSRPPDRDFSPGYFQRDAEMAFKLMKTDIDLYEGIRDLSKWSDAMKSPLIKLYSEPGLSKLWGQFCDAFQHTLKHEEGDVCKKYLANIQAPTFILHGAKDPMVPAYHPPYLLENIRNTKYFEFKDGKHNIHLKYKTEFNALVQQFLRSE